MKVILVNGSPHEKGCTYTALEEVAGTLKASGIEAEIFWIGKQPIAGCTACGGCMETKKCVINDNVNDFKALAAKADGFVFGAPVYFAGPNGSLLSFLDRAFFSEHGTDTYRLKPGAAVVSARRAGTTASLDRLNKYFTISQMPVISSRYWNMVHGNTPEEVKQDEEGLQIMRVLGRNMAWFLKCREAGEKAGIPMPEREAPVITSFIR